MFKFYTFGLAIFFLTSLSACNTSNAVKKDISFNANEEFEQGMLLYNEWRAMDNSVSSRLSRKHIQQAIWHLDQARKAQHDNARFQLMHYNALASSYYEDADYDENALLKTFQLLHPAIQSDAVTPAFISYSRSTLLKDGDEKRLTAILRATKQNPYNPQNWLYTSRMYNELNRYWLAAASAQRASELMPTSAEYRYELGRNYMKLAMQDTCMPRRKSHLKKAARAFNEASVLDKTSALPLAETSKVYIKLNLMPLALIQAKKAYHLSPSGFSARALFLAYFFSEEYDDAWRMLETLESEFSVRDERLIALKHWSMFYHSPTPENQHQLEKILTEADQHYNDDFHASLRPFLITLSNETVQIDRFNEKNHFPSECRAAQDILYDALTALKEGRNDDYETHRHALAGADNNFLLADLWGFLIRQTIKP